MVWGGMDEHWLMTILLSRWVIAAVAFAIGIYVGRRLLNIKQADTGNSSAAGEMTSRDGAGDKKIDALNEELQKAKAAINDDDDISTTMLEAISTLEETVKRANGRLKLIEKSMKKSKVDM